MADDSNEQPEQPSSGGAAGFSQEDIDALLNSASGALDAAAEGDAAAASDSTDQQANQPASGGGDPPAAEATPTPPASGTEAAGSVTQDDIDALVNAAKPGEEPAGASVAEEPPPADTRLDSTGRPFDEAAAAMQAAMDEERAAAAATAPSDAASAPAPPTLDTQPYEFQNVDGAEPINVDPKRITMLNDVNLRVRLQLGQTRMLLEEVLQLDEGSVVELDKLAGDPVDVLVNDRLVARGEVLVLNDVFCVRVCEVLSNDPHRITV